MDDNGALQATPVLQIVHTDLELLIAIIGRVILQQQQRHLADRYR